MAALAAGSAGSRLTHSRPGRSPYSGAIAPTSKGGASSPRNWSQGCQHAR